MTDLEIDLLELVLAKAPEREIAKARVAVLEARMSDERRAEIASALDKYFDAAYAKKRACQGLPTILYYEMYDEAEARAKVRHGDV